MGKGILHIMGPLNGCSFPAHQIAYLGLAANKIRQHQVYIIHQGHIFITF